MSWEREIEAVVSMQDGSSVVNGTTGDFELAEVDIRHWRAAT